MSVSSPVVKMNQRLLEVRSAGRQVTRLFRRGVSPDISSGSQHGREHLEKSQFLHLVPVSLVPQ